ncbi:MAG TPA: hypothetical protein VFR78_22540 [Pyrinomonadaceae bacterium]|nr:hypothetical protein [Pyrinomonadaceae bacterium]
MDRWTTWANSMAARHERFTGRRGLLVMTLLEPLRMSVSIHRRHENFAISVFPKIQVSIPENKTGTRITRIKERFWFGFTHEQFALVERMISQKTTEITKHQRRETLSHTHAIHLNPRVTQSPVSRFFSRFHERDAGVMLRKLLYENETQKVIERITTDHLRVEQRTRGDMVIKTQTKPSTVVEDRRRELETQFASTSKARGPSWPDKPPEINVEQLTEQVIRRIDHRITAYRERLGRAF